MEGEGDVGKCMGRGWKRQGNLLCCCSDGDVPGLVHENMRYRTEGSRPLLGLCLGEGRTQDERRNNREVRVRNLVAIIWKLARANPSHLTIQAGVCGALFLPG